MDAPERRGYPPTFYSKGTNGITRERVERCLDLDRESNWNLFSEREFMEDLFCQRFNYFLLSFSIILTAISLLSAREKITVLICGILILTLTWYTIYRAYVKMDFCLKMLRLVSRDRDGLFNMTDEEMTEQGKSCSITAVANRFSGVNKIIAVYIPLLCVVTLLALLFFSLFPAVQ